MSCLDVGKEKFNRMAKIDKETFEHIKEKAIEDVIKRHFGTFEPMEKFAMHRFLEEVIAGIMKGERDIFLENNHNNKGNGYYPFPRSAGSVQVLLNLIFEFPGIAMDNSVRIPLLSLINGQMKAIPSLSFYYVRYWYY